MNDIKRITKNKKGFTLAELLIVVAIVGVLVAISIPIFTAQLEKAREATDQANIRSAMSELQSDYLTEAAAPTNQEGNIKYAAGDGKTTYATATITLTQKDAGWADKQDHQVGNLTITNTEIGAGSYVVTLSSDGKFTGAMGK